MEWEIGGEQLEKNSGISCLGDGIDRGIDSQPESTRAVEGFRLFRSG